MKVPENAFIYPKFLENPIKKIMNSPEKKIKFLYKINKFVGNVN